MFFWTILLKLWTWRHWKQFDTFQSCFNTATLNLILSCFFDPTSFKSIWGYFFQVVFQYTLVNCTRPKLYVVQCNLVETCLKICLKWRIFSRTGKIGSGKNTNFFFFLLGLKYTLRTFFESKNLLSNSCPELSNQVLSFSAYQIC